MQICLETTFNQTNKKFFKKFLSNKSKNVIPPKNPLF